MRLNMLAELTGKETVKQLQTTYSMELGSLEDAYIVSRYMPRTYTAEEFEIFDNLHTYLRKLAEIVRRLDHGCEVYPFGSIVEGRHLYSSDVDVLVVSDMLKPGEVLAVLWAEGLESPSRSMWWTGRLQRPIGGGPV